MGDGNTLEYDDSAYSEYGKDVLREAVAKLSELIRTHRNKKVIDVSTIESLKERLDQDEEFL